LILMHSISFFSRFVFDEFIAKAVHASRSSGLLRMEASLARVSQSGLKTGGGVTAGDARGTIAEVASEAS
jgi:hypothetical protein